MYRLSFKFANYVVYNDKNKKTRYTNTNYKKL